MQKLARRELPREKEYTEWLERKHSKLVYRQEMTNAIAVFDLVVRWYIETGVSLPYFLCKATFTPRKGLSEPHLARDTPRRHGLTF